MHGVAPGMVSVPFDVRQVAARIAIGTAQFGSAYGVANAAGQVSADEVGRILALARQAGVRTLDTAVAYGGSEAALGHAGVAGFDVVTKVPEVPAGEGDVAGWIERQVEGSLTRLGVAQLDGVLMHRVNDLQGANGAAVSRGLEAVKVRGLVRKIGVSGYGPAELDAVLERYALELVQLPLSVFDRRAIDSGLLARLTARRVEIHVRSVFLQGLLVMPDAKRPPYFARWAPLFAQWKAWLDETGLTPLAAAVRFVLAVPEVNRLVLGFDTAGQLSEALAAATGPLQPMPSGLQSDDEALINPSRWTLA